MPSQKPPKPAKFTPALWTVACGAILRAYPTEAEARADAARLAAQEFRPATLCRAVDVIEPSAGPILAPSVG